MLKFFLFFVGLFIFFLQAYKNFGSRVAIVKKKLDELKLTLPDPPSPMPSPTPDAPSPGSTPPADIEMQADNTEAVDMELSESDNDTDATRNILGEYLETPSSLTSTILIKKSLFV